MVRVHLQVLQDQQLQEEHHLQILQQELHLQRQEEVVQVLAFPEDHLLQTIGVTLQAEVHLHQTIGVIPQAEVLLAQDLLVHLQGHQVAVEAVQVLQVEEEDVNLI